MLGSADGTGAAPFAVPSVQGHPAYYRCGQIVQLLLLMPQYQVQPLEARKHGLRPLTRDFVESASRLRKCGRVYAVNAR